ncbi:MAG: peptidylprolyl isomerase [Bacteroidota bacterium]
MKAIRFTFACLIIFAFLGKAQAQTTETRVLITTDLGNITVKLYNETPQHRDNFIKLVNNGFYNGTLFHRVIKSFMIQGGDPQSIGAASGTQLGNGDVGYKIPAEFNPKYYHKKGALAAARDNNPEKASSGCQFYIVQGKVYTEAELTMIESRMGVKFTDEQKKIYTTVGGAAHLDGAYTVFGEVTDGLDIVDKIAAVECDAYNRPKTDIKMTVKILE